MWGNRYKSSIRMALILGAVAILGCNGGQGQSPLTLTIVGDVAATGTTTPDSALKLGEISGTVSCNFSCDVTLSDFNDGSLISQQTVPLILQCVAGTQVLSGPQTFTILQQEIQTAATVMSVNVSCSPSNLLVSPDLQGAGNVLASFFSGNAEINDLNGPQTVNIQLINIVDSLTGGGDPSTAFQQFSCSIFPLLKTVLLLSCPTPEEPTFSEEPGVCGNGIVDSEEACDFDPFSCSSTGFPIFSCIPPGEDGECTCQFDSCQLLPFIEAEIEICQQPLVCGDGFCALLETSISCLQDCHCGDGFFQPDLEQCDYDAETGTHNCPAGFTCGFTGLPLQCQCVENEICDAGEFLCAPGSGAGCVVPCDGQADGVSDCPPDSADEDPGFCESCGPGEFFCGVCAVPCDGNPECEFDIDESPDFCGIP